MYLSRHICAKFVTQWKYCDRNVTKSSLSTSMYRSAIPRSVAQQCYAAKCFVNITGIFDTFWSTYYVVVCGGWHESANGYWCRKQYSEYGTEFQVALRISIWQNIDHIPFVIRRWYVMSLIQQNLMMIDDTGTIVVLAVTSTGNNVDILTVSVYLVNEPFKRTHNGKGGC